MPEVFERICPVVPPFNSAIDVSMPEPKVAMAVAPSLTKSVDCGIVQPKLVVVVAIYATTPIASNQVSVEDNVFQYSLPLTCSHFTAT